MNKFIQGESSASLKSFRNKPIVIHYYNEIVRYWNKLNFIIKRSIPDSVPSTPNKLAQFLYVTYRIFWESASNGTIYRELKDIERSFLKNLRRFSWEKALKGKSEKEKLSICEAIPSFMIGRLLPVMTLDFLRENIKNMNNLEEEVKVAIRFNELRRKSREGDSFQLVKNDLEKNGIKYYEDPHISYLLHIPLAFKSKVIENYWYQEGFLVFQDKASAAVVQALSPQSGELIGDMCAAPGIKTSLIAQIMRNKGRVIAGEFLTSRTEMMKNLLNDFNVLNSHVLNIDSINFPVRFKSHFDRILLDAPCTGNGTFLSNPELKWRQNENFLYQNVTLQKKLLQSALRLLKPSGILVYSTCSFYPEEGESQILDILDQVEPLDLPKWFSPSYDINNQVIPGTGRLFPSVHQTQGFFVGKFKKKG